MKKFLQRGKKLYWWLIGTFAVLYLAVAFVSTLHAITFFQLANTMGLAILLGAAYEIGQATVLFSILMSQNRQKLLAWAMMFLLTALQVTANVYASFKYMDMSQSTDWTYWQRAILFGVQAESAEMYKVIISWISGALLPLVALGMTALVADNIKMATEEGERDPLAPDRAEEIIENEVKKRLEEKGGDEPLFGNLFKRKKKDQVEINPITPDTLEFIDDESLDEEFPWEKEDRAEEDIEELKDIIKEVKAPEPTIEDVAEAAEEEIPEITLETTTKTVDAHPAKYEEKGDGKFYPAPMNKMRGWHLMNEYVDDDHNVFEKGKFIKHDLDKIPTSKKA